MEQRREERIGCATVFGTCAVLIAATVAASHVDHVSEASRWTCRSLIFAEALLASGFLFGLLFGDPGVVKRSCETCLPVPEQILGSQVPLENIVNGQQSFCVRCFVWRDLDKAMVSDLSGRLYSFAKLPRQAHHCRTCQRCVMFFDHHCSVFGRCIGSGNFAYFCGIISIGILGVLTAVVSAAHAMLVSWEDVSKHPVILVSASCFFVICCCRRPMCWLRRRLQCCLQVCMRQAVAESPHVSASSHL